ncbi:MAG TPA: L,D-transpeptidase family protein [Pyrinomonadaceae bacterium]
MGFRKVTVALAVVFIIGALSPITIKAHTSSRAGTLEVETLLSKLGYWILKVDGKPDASTRHAITAFQKVEGRKRTGRMSAADLKALRIAQRPKPRYPNAPAHIEIDLTRQVLFYVNETATVTRILPISSGNGKRFFDEGQWKVAHTPRGLFNVGRKINGVRHSSLGVLYYPSYFLGGLAIHGSNSIPTYPASHGCVRVPRFADKALFRMIKMDMEIYLYD